MGTDDLWQAQLNAFGGFVRAQRQLANLSLREMARRTNVSNAYLSQVERGLHTPSVRVLRSIAQALGLSAEAMLAQAGLFEDDAEGDADDQEEGRTSRTDLAIRNDPRLTDPQKEALLSVYRSYLAAND